MALERALGILLEEVRAKITHLRDVKKKIKGDLEEERLRANTDERIPTVRREE